MDSATGKPWLCFSVQVTDRTIDCVCKDEREVTAWFLGLQAQSPQTCFHLTRGMILWQRTIMKLNFYSLDQIKRVILKRTPDHHLNRAVTTNRNQANQSTVYSPPSRLV